jgi:RNA polymerase sigma factor (TIGR02999 family)
MSTPQPDVTTLLCLAGSGDRHAEDELFRLVEPELRRRAKAYLRRERPGHELQTTVLVDEAFVKLVGKDRTTCENRSQFYALAAKAMRRMLVDEARQRAAAKRGGGDQSAPLDRVPELTDPTASDPLTKLAVDEALKRLEEDYPKLVEIVNLHYFSGWSLKQIAEDILCIPYTTVKRRWQQARARLRREMS